jgi:hypothetical protein
LNGNQFIPISPVRDIVIDLHSWTWNRVGTPSNWVTKQIQEPGHEVMANVRKPGAISHSDRKSDKVDVERMARYARLDRPHGRTRNGACNSPA